MIKKLKVSQVNFEIFDLKVLDDENFKNLLWNPEPILIFKVPLAFSCSKL